MLQLLFAPTEARGVSISFGSCSDSLKRAMILILIAQIFELFSQLSLGQFSQHRALQSPKIIASFQLHEELRQSQCLSVCYGHTLSRADKSSSFSLRSVSGLFKLSLSVQLEKRVPKILCLVYFFYHFH